MTKITLPPRILWQLKAMFALEYAALGCFLPLLSLYLRDTLHFSGPQIGWIQACAAITAIVSPLLGAMVTNRFLPARKVLTLCHAFAAILMLCIAHASTFPSVFILYLAYQISFSPSIAITNTIAFEHLQGERNHFGGIRVWGTIAWIAVAFLVSAWMHEFPHQVQHILLLSAFFSLCMVVLSCGLDAPSTTVLIVKKFFPTEAFQAFLRWDIFRWGLLMLAISCGYQFHFMGMAPALNQLGYSSATIPILMSLAQFTEMFIMFLHRKTLLRWGKNNVMTFGAGFMALEFLIMACGAPLPWLFVALAAHGITFAAFSTTAIMVIDEQISSSERAGVHQLLGLLSPGASSLLGGLSAGALMGHGPIFWLVPMSGALVVACTCRFFRVSPLIVKS